MASPILVNGSPVIRGVIAMPLKGSWHADLVVATQDPSIFEDGVLIDFDSGALLFAGTVRRADMVADAYVLRMVGGYDALTEFLSPKSYQNVTLGGPLRDVLTDAGESLAPDSDQSVLNTSLPRWVRTGDFAHRALWNLMGRAPSEALWRMKPDGDLWVGVDSWPETSAEWTPISSDPNVGRVTVAANIPAIFPGQTIEGRKIEYALHHIEATGLRSTLRLSDE